MVAVKGQDVERTLRRADPRAVVLLFYGPDSGLVSERSRAAAESFVEDSADPFQLIRLDGDALAADPARLADEVGTIGLFGSRRALWVRASARGNIASSVEAVLVDAAPDTLVVIEAGDLSKTAPLRSLCERHPRALALPCYADDGDSLNGMVDRTLHEAGLSIAPEVRPLLLASLGGDRLASRAELAKLTLYVHGRREVTADDIEAAMSDVSSPAQDAGIDAAFGGDLPALDLSLRRLRAEGVAASTILGAALRHAFLLLAARAEVEGGRSVGSVVETWRGLHVRRKPAIQRQLARWPAAALSGATWRLQAAILESRRSAELGPALTARVLHGLASEAARSAR